MVDKKEKASLMLWVEQMGCLPSEAVEDQLEIKEDSLSKELEEEPQIIKTVNRYHDLFNEDYFKLQTHISKHQALPNIILQRDYPDLKLLPLEVLKLGKQKNITVLTVPLLALPKNIGKMTQLTELVCHKTYLKSLPETVGQLSNLSTFYVARSELTTLPNTVFDFRCFETFNVQYNEFDEVTLSNLRAFQKKHSKGTVFF